MWFIFILFSLPSPASADFFAPPPPSPAVVPQIRVFLRNTIGHEAHIDDHFHPDPDRLRNEVIALTVTGQLSDMFEEMILPLLKLKLSTWWRTYQSDRRRRRLRHAQAEDTSHTSHHPSAIATTAAAATATATVAAAAVTPILPESTSALVRSVRGQAALETYNVQDDMSEMVIQFGYLALFAPVWPLISVGFLVNNWIELRSDFLKVCTQHQRPHPVRTEGIGPWLAALEVLTWLGSISTAALVHLFGSSSSSSSKGSGTVGYGSGWMGLLVMVFVSEHLYLLLRVGIGALLRRIGSEQVRRERAATFAFRKKYLDGLEVQGKVREALYGAHTVRSIRREDNDEDALWQNAGQEEGSEQVGLTLIQSLKNVKESDETKRD